MRRYWTDEEKLELLACDTTEKRQAYAEAHDRTLFSVTSRRQKLLTASSIRRRSAAPRENVTSETRFRMDLADRTRKLLQLIYADPANPAHQMQAEKVA